MGNIQSFLFWLFNQEQVDVEIHGVISHFLSLIILEADPEWSAIPIDFPRTHDVAENDPFHWERVNLLFSHQRLHHLLIIQEEDTKCVIYTRAVSLESKAEALVCTFLLIERMAKVFQKPILRLRMFLFAVIQPYEKAWSAPNWIYCKLKTLVITGIFFFPFEKHTLIFFLRSDLKRYNEILEKKYYMWKRDKHIGQIIF